MNTADIKKRATIVKPSREHDYLYDSAYIVSCEKDHHKFVDRAAMKTAEVSILPVYDQMFSELKAYPSITKVFIPNAKLPDHVDLSYSKRADFGPRRNVECVEGRHRFKFFSMADKANATTSNEIDEGKEPQTPSVHNTPRGGQKISKYVQTIYRESSAQTDPYQPDYKLTDEAKSIPEVLLLGELPRDSLIAKNGINEHIIRWVNRFRIRKAWDDENPSYSTLTQIEFYDEQERTKEIGEKLLEDLGDDYPEPLSNTLTSKPGRVWNCGVSKLENEKGRIQKNKEREMRKLDNKVQLEKMKKDFVIDWPPCKLTRIPFISLDPDFLPSLQSIEQRKLNFEKDKLFYKTVCSKNTIEKKNAQIHKELEVLVKS